MDNEVIRRAISGYEDSYEITNTGEIYRRDHLNSKLRRMKEQQIKPFKLKDGFLYVGLWKGGKKERKLLHKLVAEAFIKNPDNKLSVWHKDGNLENNNAANLVWGDFKDNPRWQEAIEKRIINRNPNAKNARKKVEQLDLEGNIIAEFNSTREAGRAIGKANGSGDISRSCRTGKQSYGFRWRYKK